MNDTGMHVTVDRDLCIGSGDCVRIAPAAFIIDEQEGVATPQPGAASTPTEVLVRAGHNCPTNAIAVRGPDGSFLVRSAG